MKKNLILVLLSIVLFFIGCSTSRETVEKGDEIRTVKKVLNQVKLELNKNVCWINSMPGSSTKFNISGKFILLKDGSYNLKETDLENIRVFQNGIELYNIIPKVITNITDEAKEFTYSTIQGVSLKQKTDKQKSVMFELNFNYKGEILKYRIDNIPVEEAQ